MKFYVKQKLFSMKDKFTIYHENDEKAYFVEGKTFSFKNYLELLRPDGSIIFSAQKKLLSLLPKYVIFDADGKQLAQISKKFSFRPKFDVTLEDKTLHIEGSPFAHRFGVTDGHKTVAEIKKKVFKIADSYEIDIFEETKAELYLFIVIIIDQILHEGKNNS